VPRHRVGGNTLLLVEYPSRLSARFDSRLTFRHVDTALKALAEERPRTAVTLRPHPADHRPEDFGRFVPAYPDLELRVDATSSIGALIAQADLCLAATSTAALEAGAAGVGVIFLNMGGSPGPWPFDGTTPVPVAAGPDELAEAIASTLDGGDVPGRDAMLEALGADPGAVDRVVELIETTARR